MPTELPLQTRRKLPFFVPIDVHADHPSPPIGSAKSVQKLTDLTIRNLPLPERGSAYHWDAALKGFGVRVSPKGTKTFIALVGSGTRHTVGKYPLITLAEAREEARRQLAKKTLGSYEKPTTLTFEAAVEKYLAACEAKNRPITVREYRRQLALFPFKGRKLHTIKKRDVTAVLDGIKRASERAHALSGIKIFFSWCASQGHIETSPISALKAPVQRVQAKRVLSPDELKALLLEAYRGSDSFSRIVLLLALTGQRRTEIASLTWNRIGTETITLPGEVTKNHLEHTFPIGQLVRDVLGNIPRTNTSYLFPATREHVRGKPTTFFNGWSKGKAALDLKLGIAPWTLHDLRRTFATTLQSLKVPLEVREKLLNHISGTQAGVAGIYNRHGFEAEMREAIETYDRFLLDLIR